MNFEVKQNIVVLYASPYKVERDLKEGGGFAEGVTVSYLYGDDIHPSLNANGSKGQRPAKASIDPCKWPHFIQVPGLYDGEFGMTVDSKGKPTLVLRDVKFIGLMNLSPVDREDTPPKGPSASKKEG